MKLVKDCVKILDDNWRGSFTIPSSRLYPFQWNWDSGFIAIGNQYYNPERAIQELETLFSAQWSNGFLPHIIFHEEEKYNSYFPSADYWDSFSAKYSPSLIKTSGITQPPITGFVLEELWLNNIDVTRIKTLVEKNLKYHKYLFNNREFKDTGLIQIWHNWESGMDNSIWWDSVLSSIPGEQIEQIELNRKDIHEVEDSKRTRPKDIDYKRYLYLVNELRKNQYNKINDDYPFQIIDPVFNSIFIQSNKSLIKLGKIFDIDVSFYEKKLSDIKSNFNKILWENELELYFPFDIQNQQLIKKECSGSYVPIFSGEIENEKVMSLVKNLFQYNDYYKVPSCDPREESFESINYWRGPVWININWLIWKGLLKYGLLNEAELLREETINLVLDKGFFEYFDPLKNSNSHKGYGGANFSWTAALVLDMLKVKNNELG